MSSTLDSEAAFTDRAKQVGLEPWVVDKIREKRFATFGKFALVFRMPLAVLMRLPCVSS